jgi:hypothetical protein
VCLGGYFVVTYASLYLTYNLSGAGRQIGLQSDYLLLTPFGLITHFFVPLCMGFFFGGLVSLPRTIRLHAKQHLLRETWELGKANARFDAQAVVQSLENGGEDADESRKLHKSAQGLKAEVEGEVVRLRQERERLIKELNASSDARG